MVVSRPVSDALADGSVFFSPSAAGSFGELAFIWGGRSNTQAYRDTGAIYDTLIGTWTTITPPTGAVMANPQRGGYATWSTGADVYVWGGVSETVNILDNGASYNLAANSWTRMLSAGGLTGRVTVGVWTGTEAILWGGRGFSPSVGSIPLGDGKIYRP